MISCVFFGKYSSEAIKGISADRTRKAADIIRTNNGEMRDIQILMGGEYDMMIMAEMPGVEEAMKTSVNLMRATGIQFTTCTAMNVQKFDELCRA